MKRFRHEQAFMVQDVDGDFVSFDSVISLQKLLKEAENLLHTRCVHPFDTGHQRRLREFLNKLTRNVFNFIT